ncbi:MAG: MFS transporter [Merismopedia sp. SIO2A8]|nr:MFS transporter [Merismopedia sp. SIO2A8]
MLATTLTTIPASLLMKQLGRKSGFMMGVMIGFAGSILGVYAIVYGSFSLFCSASFLFGIFNGCSGFYRFAAAEATSKKLRAQAISFVLAGGIIAALVGPELATWSKDWFTPVLFAGSFVSIAVLQLIAAFLLLFVELPPLSKAERRESGRPLIAIVQQPVFLAAVLSSTCGYAVMILIMTATPLAMIAFSHSFEDAAFVIQWHVFGMFAPSFFTGFLIIRFGILNIILWGIVLNLLCTLINLLNTNIVNFTVALLMLGVGWNFMFIASTTLLTEACNPAEKAKTQATQDFIMFCFVTFVTFLSGHLLHNFGWKTINYSVIPALLMAIAVNRWLHKHLESSTLPNR